MTKKLSERQQAAFDVAPADWEPRRAHHCISVLRQLEHRHLIELRWPEDDTGWQWRRRP